MTSKSRLIKLIIALLAVLLSILAGVMFIYYNTYKLQGNLDPVQTKTDKPALPMAEDKAAKSDGVAQVNNLVSTGKIIDNQEQKISSLINSLASENWEAAQEASEELVKFQNQAVEPRIQGLDTDSLAARG